MKIKTIYCILCLINNRRYIGSTQDMTRRKGEHRYTLKNNRHDNPELQADYNLWGVENFVFEKLEVCTEDLVEKVEQYWIDYYGGVESNNTYNLCGARKGEYSAKSRERISKGKIGQKNPMYGIHLTGERNHMFGHPEKAVKGWETRRKNISAASKGDVLIG